MPSANIVDLGKIGLIEDREPQTVPNNGWTEISNIRCVDGSITPFGGHEPVVATETTPEAMVVVYQGGYYFIAYVGGTEVHAYDGTTTLEFVGPALSPNGTWEIIEFGGVGIVNNGVQSPVYGSAPLVLTNLPYSTVDGDNCSWADVGMKARLIRAFKNHLFAFDIDDCNGRDRHKVWWSHPAEGNTVPITWDPTNNAYDAGFAFLRDTSGLIMDAMTLRDTLIVYKEDSIYSISYTGRADNNIFNIRLVTASLGIYETNCVCDIGGRHFLMTDSDIGIFDGNGFQSVADEKVKNSIFSSISNSVKHLTFVTFYETENEVWVCIPEQGETTCTLAYVYSLADGAWSKRSLPNVLSAVSVKVSRPSDYTWATLPYATWADWGIDPATPSWTTWGELSESNPTRESLVFGSTGGYLYEMDNTNQADGTNIACYARKTFTDIGTKDDWHMVTRLRPHAYGDAFRIRFGTHDNLTGAVTWTDYIAFDPATDYKVDLRETGRLHAIEFSSEADVSWKVSGYEIDYLPVGRR